MKTKKNYILALALLCASAIGLTACSDDNDNPYAAGSSISIVSSSLNFDAKAAQSAIHFTAPGTVSVSTSRSWCQAQLSGDSVIVNVDQNTTFNGRSATVTLRCGADSTVLAVVQNGVVLSVDARNIGITTDEADVRKLALKSNLDLNVKTLNDWLTASIDGDSLTVNCSQNDTRNVRKGGVVLYSGGYSDTLYVVQCDFAKDLAGKYKLYFSSKSGKQSSYNVTLSEAGIKLNNQITLPTTFDASTGVLSIESGSYCGRYSGNYIYTIFGAPGESDVSYYWTGYYTGFYVKGAFEMEGNIQTIKFEGKIDNLQVDRIILRNFSSNTFSQDYDTSNAFITLFNPYLQREIE